MVDRDGVAYLRGLAEGGVIAALKHFPGLGYSTANADSGAARTLPWSTLEQVALPPFTAGIGAGAPAIMVADASVPGLTEGPASLSAAVISTVLRQRLHFSGLVITDSLSAVAISGAGSTIAGAAVQALRAGADMVWYTASPGATRQQFAAIVAAVVAAEKAADLARSRLVAAATASLIARHLAVCR